MSHLGSGNFGECGILCNTYNALSVLGLDSSDPCVAREEMSSFVTDCPEFESTSALVGPDVYWSDLSVNSNSEVDDHVRAIVESAVSVECYVVGCTALVSEGGHLSIVSCELIGVYRVVSPVVVRRVFVGGPVVALCSW